MATGIQRESSSPGSGGQTPSEFTRQFATQRELTGLQEKTQNQKLTLAMAQKTRATH